MTENTNIGRIRNIDELAQALNNLREKEQITYGLPITPKVLLHFCNPEISKDRYKSFEIRKKSGGTRIINAPTAQLKSILRLLNIFLQTIYQPGESAMGFTPGRSIVDNAMMHAGHNYVLNIDLKNFFPSVRQARVWKRLQLPPFNFPQEVASVVAGLCCAPNEEGTDNVLPQGAPTSPVLTNAICDTLDRRMRGVAKKYGLHYSRYADDMTFSSMHNVYQEDGELMTEIHRIVAEQGFEMNEKKTRLLRSGERQEVTGLTVNQKANVTRKYVRDLRQILHIWEVEGYKKAYAVFYPHYKKEKGYIKKGEPVMENVIEGRLNFLKMVKGDTNLCYLRLRQRYDKLQQVVFMDKETDAGVRYVYVQPYSMQEFKVLFETEVSLVVSEKKNLVGKCVLANMDKTLAISKKYQTQLCSNYKELPAGTSIKNDMLKDCYVTLCRAKGKNFWLITGNEPQRSKCMSVQNVQINVDDLLTLWEKKGIEAAAKALKESAMSGKPVPKSKANATMEIIEEDFAEGCIEELDLDSETLSTLEE